MYVSTFRDNWSNSNCLTEHIAILQPQFFSIDGLYVVANRELAGFEALKLRNVRLGLGSYTNCCCCPQDMFLCTFIILSERTTVKPAIGCRRYKKGLLQKSGLDFCMSEEMRKDLARSLVETKTSAKKLNKNYLLEKN